MAEGVEHLPRDLYEQPQEIELAVNPVIIRAKKGVDAFRHSYEAGNDEWKSVLTETQLGQELQAMYLGLKPALSIDYISPHGRELLVRNIGKRFGIRGDMIYDRDLVAEVIAENADTFSDYSPDTPLDDYMEQVD